jgi:serine/threonine-protein kinase RsbW
MQTVAQIPSPAAESEQECLRIRLPAEAGNVTVLRQAAVAAAEKVGMRAERVADLKTAVSEACANVVLHAYADRERPGPIEVEITAGDAAVTTVIRDFGRGLRPAVSRSGESLGLGLSLIGALSTCFQLRSAHDRGTEIAFQVPLRGAGPG